MRIILDNDWQYVFEKNYTRFCIHGKHDWWYLNRWDNTGGWQNITSIPSNSRDEAIETLIKIAKDFL